MATLNKYGISYFACDVREFYSGFVEWKKEQHWKEGGEDAWWNLVRGIQGLRELTLVLVDCKKEYGYGISETAIEFLDPDWDGMSEVEKKEMAEWKEWTRLKLEQMKCPRNDWELPKVRFAYARRKEKSRLEILGASEDRGLTGVLPPRFDDSASAEYCLPQRPLSLL
jgi:hypothetical protein